MSFALLGLFGVDTFVTFGAAAFLGLRVARGALVADAVISVEFV
jgi:hypothetical protein